MPYQDVPCYILFELNGGSLIQNLRSNNISSNEELDFKQFEWATFENELQFDVTSNELEYGYIDVRERLCCNDV